MLPRDRVRATFTHEKTDRVPRNYLSNPGIDARLKKHFGLTANDDEGLRRALKVDLRGVGPRYVGPPLHEQVPDRRVDPLWGWHTRLVEHESGDYWDFCDFPLKDADEEQVAAWPMPSPDDYDYSSLRDQCREYADYGIHVGNPGLACVMNTAGFFRGMDTLFVDLALDEPAGLLLIDRFLAIQLEVARRQLEVIGDRVDFVWIGEDLGTQKCPIISREMFLKHIKPRHQPFIDLAKAYDLPVMIHTCGSSSWSYEDYLAMGVAAFDTLQPEATNMSPEYLVEHFGDRASFHGCISTTGVLAFGTPADVRDQVRHTLEVMMPKRGYFLAPAHQIQDNSPTENVLEMYAAADELGQY